MVEFQHKDFYTYEDFLEIMQLLRSSNRDLNQTLIVITHDEDIALMADRVIAIEDGRLVRDERRR